MNILFFTVDYKPMPGGIAEYSFQIAKQFNTKVDRVLVLAPRLKGDNGFDTKQPFKTYRVPNTPIIGPILLFCFFIYLVWKFKIDYVYNVMWYPCGVISASWSLFLRFKFIIAVHAHEALYSRNSIRGKLKAKLRFAQVWTLNRANKVFAVSRYTRRQLIQIGVDSDNVAVFNNGVNLEKFETTEKYKKAIDKYNLKGKRIILTVSRLDKRKGHDMVIKALPKVLEKVPNAVYLIAGTGEREKYLRDLVIKMRLENQVIFLGYVPDSDLPKLYNICDVFIMASRIEGRSVEGFGIAFLEANACKKPVIGGKSGGIPDAIIDGETGFLIDPEDPDEIAETLIKLLVDKELAIQMGEKGFERVKRELTWDKITTKMLEALEDMRK